MARNNTKNGLYAVKLGGRGDVTKSRVHWRYKEGIPNIPSPLLYNGVLFILREGGILTSLSPTDGSVYKPTRVEGAVDASRGGKLAMIKLVVQWEVLSVGDFAKEIWETPAAADQQLFVRTQKALYCFEAPRAYLTL